MPKEGVALVNGTQAHTAVAALALVDARVLWETAHVAGAASLEALLGTPAAFDPRIHAARGQAGQQRSAALLLSLLSRSQIRESHRYNDPRVQDAYSVRCTPQILGAVGEGIAFAERLVATELNAATDNPLVFGDAILSGGNFHGQPIALALDVLAIALTTLAGLAERRLERIVNPDLSSGLPAFLAEAKAHPGKINFAFAGLCSGTHLNSEKFKLDAKIDFTLVAYKGSSDAITDVLGGRVDSYFSPISAGLPFIQSGKLRALAVTSAKRSSQLPSVPTIAESGVPGFEFRLWFGLWGPQGIPAPVLAKIRKDFGAALTDAAVRDKLSTLGNDVIVMTPAEFGKFVRREIADTARIFKAAGIKPQ